MGYPYLVGLHYNGGLYGISLSLFFPMCFFGALNDGAFVANDFYCASWAVVPQTVNPEPQI